MRVNHPDTGNSYFSKRRRRFDDVRTARSLTFSCYKRFPFLSKDRTRIWFVEGLQEAREKFPVDLWAWVILPEHVQLLVCPRESGQVTSKFQGFLKEQVARRAIAWLEENAPEWLSRMTVIEGKRTRRRFWQPGGGYDRNCEQDKVIMATLEYLHQNPVRKGLVERPTEWEWSSARWYNGDRDCRLEMDRSLPMTYDDS